MRRGAMNRFFSKESVRRLEPILQAKLDKLLEKLEGFKGAGRAVNVNLPFNAFTGDVITEYCFATTRSYLDMEDFNAQFFEMMVGIHDMAPVARQFVVIPMLMDSLPDWVVERIDHGFNLWGRFRRVC